MKERPILYSAPMALARNDGRKIQTRRIVKVSAGWNLTQLGRISRTFDNTPPYDLVATFVDPKGSFGEMVTCPYGQPGDRLRGKENAWVWCRKERDGDTKTGRPKYNYIPVSDNQLGVIYQADHPERPTHRLDIFSDHDWRLKIGRYLPAWASRMLDEITSIKVERVQDISEEDAKSEGFACLSKDGGTTWKYGIPDRDGLPGTDNTGWPWSEWEVDPRKAFRTLWIKINGAESWEHNPWVWVIEFRPVPAAVDHA